MNGPKLSPHGQLPMPTLEQRGHVTPPTHPAPVLASPSRPHAKQNGFQEYHQNDQSTHQRPSFSQSTLQNHNGVAHHHHPSHGTAWPTYDTPPPHRPENMENFPQHATAYSYQNPFLNSFDRQRPSSSHSNISNHSVPSPIKNRPSMSPAQSVKDLNPLSFPQSGTPAGAFPPQTARTNGTSPKKQSSPPIELPYSSSPMANSSSGISPTKHSPPRPSSNHSIAGTPVLPPVASLSPSPRPQDFGVPSKGLPFEQARINGHVTTQ